MVIVLKVSHVNHFTRLSTALTEPALPLAVFSGAEGCAATFVEASEGVEYGCNVHNDRGAAACGNPHAFQRTAVDGALLDVVRTELPGQDAISELERPAMEVAAASAPPTTLAGTASRLGQVEAEIERLVDAISQMGLSDAVRNRLAAVGIERDALRNQVASARKPGLTSEQLARDCDGDCAEMEEPAQRVGLAGSTIGTLVARARFELATFGL